MNDCRKKLMDAIKTAREAAERAERIIGYPDTPDSDATQQVLSALAWGHANAMSNIELAIMRIEKE